MGQRHKKIKNQNNKPNFKKQVIALKFYGQEVETYEQRVRKGKKGY